MSIILNSPELLIAPFLIIALALSITSIGLILSTGHHNFEGVKFPSEDIQFCFDRAVEVKGTVYYRQAGTGFWLDILILNDDERKLVENLVIEKMDSKPWVADKH